MNNFEVVINDAGESSPKKIKREACKFGLKCFRKNIMHFAVYDHPDNHPYYKLNKLDDPNISDNTKELTNESPKILDDLYLTKIINVNSTFKELSLSDILSNSSAKLIKSVQFNFMFDCDWLLLQYPNEFRKCPLLLVHGNMFNKKEISQSNIESCEADLPLPYGTHHTKMMFLQYNIGIRVVIHTANLIPEDWNKKTQCIWMSDIFPLIENPKATGDSQTEFKKDLIEYLSSYRKKPIKDWIDIIQKHDFSTCKVYFISSSPGRHHDENLMKFGHMKLRKILQKNVIANESDKDFDLIAQFSSIGSLGSSKESWLLGEFQTSLMASQSKDKQINNSEKINFHLIYPCVEDVRNSLEGYLSGSSLPYTQGVHSKQLWIREFFRKWSANISNRKNAAPHMKSYLKLSEDLKIHWFIITSANLSKAAWGSLEKKNSQLAIRSYEVGVLFLPNNYYTSYFSTNGKHDTFHIPIPYDLPPIIYNDNDEPWLVDKDYKEPDICGSTWCH